MIYPSLLFSILVISVVSEHHQGNCNFESGFCNWKSSNISDFPWHRGNGSTTDISSGPTGDHTFDDSHGHYLYIKGREARTSSMAAEIYTECSDLKDLGLSFWYYMNGNGIGTLSVVCTFVNGSDLTLWKKSGRQGSNWNEAKIALPSNCFQLLLRATARRHYGSDIAVDDITFGIQTELTLTTESMTTESKPVLRKLPYICNFDKDMCDSFSSTPVTSLSKWVRTVGQKIYQGTTYITGDNKTASGHYILFDNPKTGQNGDTAALNLPPISGSRERCLTFSCLMPSKTSGTISVFTKLLDSGKEHLVYEISGYHGEKWMFKYISLPVSPDYRIVIEGTYTGEPASYVALDDIRILNGHCIDYTTTSTTPTMPPMKVIQDGKSCVGATSNPITELTCSFQDDLCDYHTSGSLTWFRQKEEYGFTWAKLIPGGHLGENDTYLTTNVNKYTVPNHSTADIESDLVNRNHICVEFWYILPNQYSNLKLFLQSEWGAQELLWEGHGQNSVWKKQVLEIKYFGRFKIIFRSNKKHISGVVGLDDINGYNVLSLGSTTATVSNSSDQEQTTENGVSLHPGALLTTSRPNLESITSKSTSVQSVTRNTEMYSSSLRTSNKATTIGNSITVETTKNVLHTISQNVTVLSYIATNRTVETNPNTATRTSSYNSTTTATNTAVSNEKQFSETIEVSTKSTIENHVTSQNNMPATLSKGGNSNSSLILSTISKTSTVMPKVSHALTTQGKFPSTTDGGKTLVHSSSHLDVIDNHKTEMIVGICVPVVSVILVCIIIYLYKKKHSNSSKIASSRPEEHTNGFKIIINKDRTVNNISLTDMTKLSN